MKGIFWIEIGLVQLILVRGCMDHLLSSCYFVMAVQCTYFIISKEDHIERASQPVLYLASIAFLPCSENITENSDGYSTEGYINLWIERSGGFF